MDGVYNFSLTFLPLSSVTFNEEGSGSFISSHFIFLTTLFELFWSAILIYVMVLIVMTLTHALSMHLNLALVNPEVFQYFYMDYMDYLLDIQVFPTLKNTK